jgi:DNA modification methylase
MELNKIYQGNSLEVIKTLPDESINTVVTSPPYYGLRDYGVDGQIGLEVDVEEYVQSMVNLFREIKRVLKEDGTVWLNPEYIEIAEKRLEPVQVKQNQLNHNTKIVNKFFQ